MPKTLGLIFLMSLSISCTKSEESKPIAPPQVTTVTVGPECEKAGSTLSKNQNTSLKGLKPLSVNEQKLMEKEMGIKQIDKILPNALGLSRVNKVRTSRGKEKLLNSKDLGKDIVTSDDLEQEVITEELYGGDLPSAVDNSTLPSFPPIGQQAWNSCVGWAMGYYQWSHNNGLALGWNNKTSSAHRCSPKFVYSMINEGLDNGAYFSDAFNLLQKHGCISWDHLPEDRDFKGWSTNPEHWSAAIPYRSNTAQYIRDVDTATGLNQVKQLLNNGYVLTFGTYIESWQFTTIKSAPIGSSNSLAGQHVLKYVNGTLGSHAMTVVGYIDDAWTDINDNNNVDAGELGVLKIANSWGAGWKNKGYVYVPYDALKTISGVPGGPGSNRQPAFQSRLVYHMPVKAIGGVAYKPKYLAKFTLNHGARNQLSLKFGWSTNDSSFATHTINPFALMNKGGSYSFNGTSAPINATFVMDISDLPVSSYENKFYLTVSDNKAGNSSYLSSFEVINLVNSTQSASREIESNIAIDETSRTVSTEFLSNLLNTPPIAKFTSSMNAGNAPLLTTFEASESKDPDGLIASYFWDFGDGSFATGPFISKTFSTAGRFTVVLTVKDNDGATSSFSETIVVQSSDNRCN